MSLRTCEDCGTDGLLSLEGVRRVYGSNFDGYEKAKNNPHIDYLCENCGATK